MPILLSATNLQKSYSSATANAEKTSVLRGVSLEVEQSEMVAIVGSSGAGKSTLLHLLGALDEADEGEIMLRFQGNAQTKKNLPQNGSLQNGASISYKYKQLSDIQLASLRNSMLGFIFQFHHLLPEFTALENVMMPALIAGESHAKARDKATELLNRVGLSHRLTHKPDALSGGEQQRTAFARAMMNSPILVFADEPTGNLDAANSALLLDLMKQFREESGTTFVIVTHSQEIAQGADRIIRLHEGMVVK